MDSIKDILATRKYDEPEEVTIIKEFVRESFGHEVQVAVSAKNITITTPSAGLAGTLRMHIQMLNEICQTDKKLIIRIG